ncbi:NAD(P)-dependent oxidoreductase [Alcaligenaceae bacterium 429]|nr:NAD(P)-dependent oxidoreductase [Alcaligenaceae bacterium 429]
MTTTQPRIAFLGTGLMGAPMCANLLKHGFTLTVWNRSPEKAQALAPLGATVTHSAAEAVSHADVVFTMLSNDEAVESMVLDPAILAAAHSGTVFIDSSSTRPATAKKLATALAEHQLQFVDCPVSGGVKGAQEGTLALMAGGPAALIESLAPVFSALGRLTHVGDHGAGQVAKLANQQIVAITIGAIAEAMTLVSRSGGSAAAFRDAIRGGFAESTILALHGERMINRHFEPGGPCKHQYKDLRNIQSQMALHHLQLPLTNAVTELFGELCEDGGAELDHSALLLQIERLNPKER